MFMLHYQPKFTLLVCCDVLRGKIFTQQAAGPKADEYLIFNLLPPFP